MNRNVTTFAELISNFFPQVRKIHFKSKISDVNLQVIVSEDIHVVEESVADFIAVLNQMMNPMNVIYSAKIYFCI